MNVLEHAMDDAWNYRMGEADGFADPDLDPYDLAIAKLYSAVPNKTVADLQATLAKYDAACQEWAEVQKDQSEGVRDAERYSEALERVAHDLVALVRPLVVEQPEPEV